MIRPTPPRARSAKYAASRSVSRARSSRPVCIDPITTRLRRVVKPRSNGDNRFGYVTDPPQRRRDFIEPVDRAFLRADAAAQHEVLVQGAALQGARIGELPLLESPVGVQQFGPLGPQRGHLSTQCLNVAVFGTAHLHGHLAGAVVGHRAAAPRQRFGDPAGQLDAALRRTPCTPSCPACPAGRRASRAPSRRPPSPAACDRSADEWRPRNSRWTDRTGGPARIRSRPVRTAPRVSRGEGPRGAA